MYTIIEKTPVYVNGNLQGFIIHLWWSSIAIIIFLQLYV